MDIYTMKDWERDGSLSVKEGQIIDSEVFWELADCVPPQTFSSRRFQVGEPHTHRDGVALYDTFEHVGDDCWRYLGLRP